MGLVLNIAKSKKKMEDPRIVNMRAQIAELRNTQYKAGNEQMEIEKRYRMPREKWQAMTKDQQREHNRNKWKEKTAAEVNSHRVHWEAEKQIMEIKGKIDSIQRQIDEEARRKSEAQKIEKQRRYEAQMVANIKEKVASKGYAVIDNSFQCDENCFKDVGMHVYRYDEFGDSNFRVVAKNAQIAQNCFETYQRQQIIRRMTDNNDRIAKIEREMYHCKRRTKSIGNKIFNPKERIFYAIPFDIEYESKEDCDCDCDSDTSE